MGHLLLHMSHELEKTRRELSDSYGQIATSAINIIRTGVGEENPILLGEADTRYALYVCGFISGEADIYLENVTQKILSLESTMRPTCDGYRHVTLGELRFDPLGRRNAGINVTKAIQYYKSIQSEFSAPGHPIELVLDRIMLAQDKEQRSLSLVAAFLPQHDLILNEVRNRLTQAVKRTELPMNARLGQLSLILCTLGRFPHPPEKADDSSPVLEELVRTNSNLPEERGVVIKALVVGSTTLRSYVWADQHAFFIPPILLDGQNEPVSPQVIRANW